MTPMAYSAPDWESGPRARNTSEGEGGWQVQRKVDWAKSQLSWAYPVFLLWDGLQFRFFCISGRSCELHHGTREGLPDFPLVFSVFSWPTWQGSPLPRKRMATCSYC